MSRQRALVLGASGHVGRAFVAALQAGGYRVTAVARRARLPFLSGLDVDVLRADVDTGDWLPREASRHDVVIDAAAPYPLSPAADGAAVERARRRTHRVTNAVLQHDRALVFVGSFVTLPRRRSPMGDVVARLRRRAHPYFAVKRAMESVVLSACDRGLRAVIVNPTACFGPWDDKPRGMSFVRALVSGDVPFVTPEPVNVVDVRDVAEVALRALSEGLFGTPLLCAGHDTWVDELAEICAEIAGVRPPPVLPLPGGAAIYAALSYGVEQACAAARVKVPPTALAAMLLCDLGHVGQSPAMRALGVRPRPLRQTLRDTVESQSSAG